MSEPSSLYARFPISASSLDAFRASPALGPAAFPDWSAWFATRSMHGGAPSAREISEMTGTGQTVGDALDEWLYADQRFPGNAQESFDNAESVWTLSMVEFSENYLEYMFFLSLLRGAAPFLGDGGGAVAVHDYLWGDTGTDVAVLFEDGKSTIVDQIPAPLMDEVTERLDAHVAELRGER